MWIDTHCHLDAPEFEADRSEVIDRARAAGVRQVVVPAVERANFDAVRRLAHRHGLAYALGIHPLFVAGATDDDLDALRQALRTALDPASPDDRLVAVGEIGLDHFVPGTDLAKQERFCLAQLRMAHEFGLPVILHSRRSVDSLARHLRASHVAGGIAHAFNGSEQQARVFVELGFKLGFGGALTFDRALRIRRLAQSLRDEDFVLETDAPDIPPHWLYRTAAQRAAGERARNEPAELPRIAQGLAALRGVSVDELAATTAANACAALPRLRS